MSDKHILFITGTRADYGKIKSLLYAVKEYHSLAVFVTGMHMLKQYGSTYKALEKDGFKDVSYTYINQHMSTTADEALASTIQGLSLYCKERKPNMIVVHGDRLEALAGAIVGSFNNILVAHIEGGDCTGTIDESIRHAISKFSHLHFVVNTEAAGRLQSMGENPKYIYEIGSPDIDLLFSQNLPSLSETKEHYTIPFEQYAIVLYHPVTTEENNAVEHVRNIVDALIESKENYIVIAPNNDRGSEFIFEEYKRFHNNSRIRYFPSIGFEHFLTLLKHASYLIGNSSAGIRETKYYGVYTINIGTRQQGRYNIKNQHIISVPTYDKESIIKAIQKIKVLPVLPCLEIEQQNSTKRFIEIIQESKIWNTPIQKKWYYSHDS